MQAFLKIGVHLSDRVQKGNKFRFCLPMYLSQFNVLKPCALPCERIESVNTIQVLLKVFLYSLFTNDRGKLIEISHNNDLFPSKR